MTIAVCREGRPNLDASTYTELPGFSSIFKQTKIILNGMDFPFGEF